MRKLENQKTGKLENRKIGKLENRKIGKSESWKTGKLENWKVEKLECLKTRFSKFPNFRISDFPIFQFSTLLSFKFSSFQVFKFSNKLHQHRTKGSMLMEFVLVMPLLFILIMGVVQIAHIWTARMVTHYAAFCAARATLTVNVEQAQNLSAQAARQVCAWMVFSDTDRNNDNDARQIPGWGQIPHSTELASRVRVTVLPAKSGAPWLSGARVDFDFPLLIPVAGTMMGWLVHPNTTDAQIAEADYKPVSGWTGQKAHGNYDGPYITLSETVWLPKPYSTKNYPVSEEDARSLFK